MAQAETKTSTQVELAQNSLSKEGVPLSVLLKYPTTLYAEQIAGGPRPTVTAVEAIKLGALADRGAVVQHIGGIPPFELNVSDFPPYPATTGKMSTLFSIDRDAIRFLRSKSALLARDDGTDAADFVKDWFLRAVNLRQRFMLHRETRELLTFRVGKKHYLFSSRAIDWVWTATGLPQIKDPTKGEILLHIPFTEKGITRGRA